MRKKTLHRIKITMLCLLFFCIFLLIFCVNAEAYSASVSDGGVNNVKDIYVRLCYKGRVWEYRYPDIYYCGGFDSAAESGFQKDFRGRIKERISAVVCNYSLKDGRQKLEAIAQSVDSDPVRAEISFNPKSRNMFTVKDDIKGKRLNVEKLYTDISKSLSAGRSYDAEIQPELINAEVTSLSLKKAFGIRKEFSTDYSLSSPERKHNISLSLGQFNGMTIAPNDVISFNGVVGVRSAERGYKTSKIISGGAFVEGIGGGVCQASTTLYNALLLADVKICEYHRHSLAVSYVPPSFDAMVNISTADLKFCNNTGNFLFVKTWTDNEKAYVRIYGEELDYTIKRKSTVIKVYDTPKEEIFVDKEGRFKNLYEGERRIIVHSKPKKETKGELLYYRNGVLFKTVALRRDIYLQLVGKEVIGTAKRGLSAG